MNSYNAPYASGTI